MPIDDEDMIYIQTLFIHTPKWHRQRNLERFTLFACTGFAVFVMVALLMAGK
jgi:hypothetical protein